VSLDQTKVVIVVFAMPSCPACHDYLPRLYKQVEGFQKLGAPLFVYEEGTLIPPKSIPVMVYDVTAQNDSVQAFANQWKVENLPTTILLPKVGFPARYEGALSNDDIYNLLNAAVATNR
jgi:thiol-disulfide isomerase/thioredoxin